ncbi:MAG: ABC transporter ATP-binding protein [Ruminococcaceae bacterium]|jgi:putative ABC transport system ATP-binding protein|nr:ABC transporter ATP-binding protein [Oscillospiraceae bacterium]
MPILELSHIRKEFVSGPRTVQAIRDLNLKIETGEMTAIVGPSGAGKSTLLQIMAGLMRPTKGQVLFDGRDLYAMKETEFAAFRRDHISYVFQHFNLLPMLTARENIAVPALLNDVKPTEETIRAITDPFGISGRLDHFPSELSGGEQQRVAIARALINDPDVIFADEPTGNLDSAASGDVMEIFANLNRAGKTVLIVTHDPQVAGYCTKIIKIVDGSVA